MAIIGNLTKKENGTFEGNIETLTLNITRVSFEPLIKRGDKSPDYRIFAGLAEIGAAWKRSGENGEHLSVRIDDPSFSAPIDCRLVKTGAEPGYSLIWERDRKRS
jgi:uncharacterized protein (DUF736 family)